MLKAIDLNPNFMISENIRLILEQVRKKCSDVGRNPSEITLIAVSKNFGAGEINEAFNCGVNNFGENKAQELKDKFEIIGNAVNWHFIGHLQTNKVKYVVKAADYIHSVDSLKLAEEINKQAEKISKNIKVLLEIKTSDEVTKYGLSDFNEIQKISAFCNNASNLQLVGLMTMAPFVDDEQLIRNSFAALRHIKERLNNSGFKIKELSMGMTNDFNIAIEEGATMLRIGTAIFGGRNYLN